MHSVAVRQENAIKLFFGFEVTCKAHTALDGATPAEFGPKPLKGDSGSSFSRMDFRACRSPGVTDVGLITPAPLTVAR